MTTEMRIFLMTKQGQDVMEQQKCVNQIPDEPDSSYYDHFCSVTNDYLIIKQFFCPSKLPFEIPWKKIKKLEYCRQKDEDRSKMMSKGSDNDGRWWAFDLLRCYEREKDVYNIRIDCDVEPPKSGFSVVNIDEFLEAYNKKVKKNII